LVGGISNGITGSFGDDEGRGIAFSQGPEQERWRWNEQWMPNTTWMLLAVSLLNSDEHVSQCSSPAHNSGSKRHRASMPSHGSFPPIAASSQHWLRNSRPARRRW